MRRSARIRDFVIVRSGKQASLTFAAKVEAGTGFYEHKFLRTEIKPQLRHLHFIALPDSERALGPIEQILRKLAADVSVEAVLRDYPRLTREDVQAALAYASDAVGSEEILLTGSSR